MQKILKITKDMLKTTSIMIDGYKYKRVKNPMAPKKPLNSYQLYIQDKRKSVKEKNLKPYEIIRLLANKWKTIKTKEKESYQKKAKQLQQDYMEEKKNYTGDKYTLVRCNKKHNHFKREKKELTKYNLFISTEIKKLKTQHELPHKEIFKMAISNWNKLNKNTTINLVK
jgi:hypothetical protein